MNHENLNAVVKVGSMDDVGTRLQFLTELYELWQTGLDICERYDKHTVFYAEHKRELESALKLLGFHMEKDYKEQPYRNTIDALPKHGEDIKGDA
jgi:hypothetical protein